jgi:hypothetical protein
MISAIFAADAGSRVMSAKQYLHCEQRKIVAQKLSIALDKEVKEPSQFSESISMNYSRIRKLAKSLEHVKREVRNKCL